MDKRQKQQPPLTPELRAWCEAETVRLLPLIETIAYRTNLPLPIEDLIQEGAIAAFETLPRYDASRGLTVATFVTPRIWGAMRDYARNRSRLMQGGSRSGRVERIMPLHAVLRMDAEGNEFRLEHALADPFADAPDDERWDALLKGFTAKERFAVRQYFLADKSMREIGEALGVSESRISGLLASVFKRLRELDAEDCRVREMVA